MNDKDPIFDKYSVFLIDYDCGHIRLSLKTPPKGHKPHRGIQGPLYACEPCIKCINDKK